jgi:hypothetical protein
MIAAYSSIKSLLFYRKSQNATFVGPSISSLESGDFKKPNPAKINPRPQRFKNLGFFFNREKPSQPEPTKEEEAMQPKLPVSKTLMSEHSIVEKALISANSDSPLKHRSLDSIRESITPNPLTADRGLQYSGKPQAAKIVAKLLNEPLDTHRSIENFARHDTVASDATLQQRPKPKYKESDLVEMNTSSNTDPTDDSFWIIEKPSKSSNFDQLVAESVKNQVENDTIKEPVTNQAGDDTIKQNPSSTRDRIDFMLQRIFSAKEKVNAEPIRASREPHFYKETRSGGRRNPKKTPTDLKINTLNRGGLAPIDALLEAQQNAFATEPRSP